MSRPTKANNKEKMYDRATLDMVVQMVLEGVSNVRETCRQYNIHEATIRRNVARLRVAREIPNGAIGVTNRRIFTDAEEKIRDDL